MYLHLHSHVSHPFESTFLPYLHFPEQFIFRHDWTSTICLVSDPALDPNVDVFFGIILLAKNVPCIRDTECDSRLVEVCGLFLNIVCSVDFVCCVGEIGTGICFVVVGCIASVAAVIVVLIFKAEDLLFSNPGASCDDADIPGLLLCESTLPSKLIPSPVGMHVAFSTLQLVCDCCVSAAVSMLLMILFEVMSFTSVTGEPFGFI